MAEYIEREALERSLNERLNRLFKLHGRHDHYVQGFDDCVGRVEEFPAADVAPVRHGKWKRSGALLECQRCGEIYSQLGGNAGKSWNYCPNCGCRMDLEG